MARRSTDQNLGSAGGSGAARSDHVERDAARLPRDFIQRMKIVGVANGEPEPDAIVSGCSRILRIQWQQAHLSSTFASDCALYEGAYRGNAGIQRESRVTQNPINGRRRETINCLTSLHKPTLR